jgi:2',3'-cyclic-nucleotide 2'-phosphodiesterase (5'-nucleotidase family)
LKSPLTQPTAPAARQTISTFSLTVLHTNDTWGYLVPCG